MFNQVPREDEMVSKKTFVAVLLFFILSWPTGDDDRGL